MGAAGPRLISRHVPTVDDVDEQAVNPAIAGHLGVKRRGQHRALPHRDRVIGGPGQHLHTRTDPLHPRRADEDRVHRIVEPVERDIAFERVDLTTKSVAPHGDIDAADSGSASRPAVPASRISLASRIMPAHAP